MPKLLPDFNVELVSRQRFAPADHQAVVPANVIHVSPGFEPRERLGAGLEMLLAFVEHAALDTVVFFRVLSPPGDCPRASDEIAHAETNAEATRIVALKRQRICTSWTDEAQRMGSAT